MNAKNLYAYNILNSTKVELDQDYAFLISTLLHIESMLESGDLAEEDFAYQLLKTVNNSNAFVNIDRVCLSLTHKNSSKLSVLSSANTEKLNENELNVGYSCYVKSDSSIKKTGSSSMRIYSDIDEIIETYSNHPVQRSLAKLKRMGVKSGITIPIEISNFVSGFLFMNSAETHMFSHFAPEDYTVLCLIKLLATSAMSKRFYGTYGVDNYLGEFLKDYSLKSNVFNSEEFKKKINEALKSLYGQNPKINLELYNNEEKFFFPTNPVIYTLVKSIEFANNTNLENISIRISKTQKSGKPMLEVKLSGVDFYEIHLKKVQDISAYTAQEITYKDNDLCLVFDFEKADDVDYSV